MTIEGVLKGVARGEMPWTRLRDYGLSIELDTAAIVSDGLREPVRVTGDDLAAGLEKFASDPGALRMWVRVIHGSPGLFELALDDHPQGEAVLDLLWRLSFGEHVELKEIRDLLKALRS